MTEEKKKGFQIKYDPEDFIIVLGKRAQETDKTMKNSQVREALIKLNRGRYKNISAERVKQILIDLADDGKIEGGKDEELGIYLWKMKR